jgi:hypothetical protein
MDPRQAQDRAPPALLSARGGLHVPGTRLWLDGNTRYGIGFLQAHDGLRHRASRLLCTRTAATLLASRGAQPLTPPLGRPFQMGRLALELLPAGSSPGSALLRIHLDGQVLLYAGAGRLDTLPTAEPIQWREADVLAVDATLADRDLADVSQLLEFVEQAVGAVLAGQRVALRLHEPSVALDALVLVAARVPVVLTPALVRLAGKYALADVQLPLRPKRKPAGPLLALELDVGPRTEVDERWLIAPDVSPAVLTEVKATRCLGFARQATGRQLDALVRASGVRQVLAFGAQAEVLCARLQADGLACEILRSDAQLRLV